MKLCVLILMSCIGASSLNGMLGDAQQWPFGHKYYFSQTYGPPERGERFIQYVNDLITQGKDLNQNHEYDDPPLFLSVNLARYHDMHAVITQLLDKGADVNLKSKNSIPLVDAIIYKAPLSIIKLLLDKGADIHKKTQGAYPLEDLCHNGNIPIIKLLLSCGANPDHGFRKITWFEYDDNAKKRIVIARILKNHGASSQVQTSLRENIINEAQRDYPNLATFIKDFEIIRKNLFDAIERLDVKNVKNVLKKWGYTHWQDEQKNSMLQRVLMVYMKNEKGEELTVKKKELFALAVFAEPGTLTTDVIKEAIKNDSSRDFLKQFVMAIENKK